MTDIVKVKQGGTQVFPQTHWNAVEGKPEVLKGEKGARSTRSKRR